MAKRQSKSETLTIRLDPKTRFMLEFVARLRGQTITTVVERAIADAANRAAIEADGGFGADLTWRDFWSVTEGERALKTAGQRELHPTYEEERRLAFASRFWPFFFTNAQRTKPKTEFVEILWPRIDEFLEMHDKGVSENAEIAVDAMRAALSASKLDPPAWPPLPDRTTKPRDDLPF